MSNQLATSTALAPRWPVRLTVTSQRGVPVHIRGVTHAPSTGRAFAVLDACAGVNAVASSSDELAIHVGEALRPIDEMLASVLPLRLWSTVRPLSPSNRRAVALAILTVIAADVTSAPDEDDSAEIGEGLHRSLPMTRERTLTSAVRIARDFGWTLADVLAMPWPEFVLVAREADALRARDTLEAMSAAHPTKTAIDELVERMRPMTERAARDREAARPPTAWEREGISLEAYRERQLERAREIKKAMVLAQRGAA